jgi:hypothetical protein
LTLAAEPVSQIVLSERLIATTDKPIDWRALWRLAAAYLYLREALLSLQERVRPLIFSPQ